MPYQRNSDGLILWTDSSVIQYTSKHILPGDFILHGAADPSTKTWTPGGGLSFVDYEFAIGEEIFYSEILPQNYKEGTNLKMRVHWTPHTRGNEESGNTVTWTTQFSVIQPGAAFPSSQVVSAGDLYGDVSGADYYHEVGNLATLSGSGLTIGSMIKGRLYRAGGGSDTWATNTAGNLPALLGIELIYQVDVPGGTLNETSK